MEIEWYHGDREDFKIFATNLAKTHDLIPEDASKLQRGFAKNIWSRIQGYKYDLKNKII